MLCRWRLRLIVPPCMCMPLACETTNNRPKPTSDSAPIEIVQSALSTTADSVT